MIIKSILKLLEGENLTEEEAYNTIKNLNSANEMEIMMVLYLWEIKGYTVDEIVGAAKATKEQALSINLPHELIVDVCGMGGSKKNIKKNKT